MRAPKFGKFGSMGYEIHVFGICIIPYGLGWAQNTGRPTTTHILSIPTMIYDVSGLQ